MVTADRVTLQFDAHSQRLEGSAADEAKDALIKVRTKRAGHITDKTVFFAIKPFWMRLQDYNERPVLEMFYELEKE